MSKPTSTPASATGSCFSRFNRARSQARRAAALSGDDVLAAMRRHPDRRYASRYAPEPELIVDRERGRYGAWYELFPRSQGRDPRRPTATTFRQAEWRLPDIAAMGFEARPAVSDEVKEMERLLGEAMDAGAFGFSTGLVYAPSAYSETPELIALARAMARRNGLYFSHIRGESSMLLDSVAEAIRIGEEGGVGVEISHVKASGRENWPKIDQALRMFEDARKRGVDVLGDVYPYNAGSTKLDNLMPGWAQDGGIDKLIERLSDPAGRRKIADECLIDGERWRTGGSGEVGFDQVFIASCKRRELEGLSLAEIARQSGLAPVDALMNLLVEQKCTAGMVSFTQSIDNVAKVVAHPALMIGSDSIPLFEGDAHKPGKPHPRTYGTFPRVLGEFARERRLISMETAVHKMTGMPAARLGLRDRGLVREGFAADLTVFDPATVADRVTVRWPSADDSVELGE